MNCGISMWVKNRNAGVRQSTLLRALCVCAAGLLGNHAHAQTDPGPVDMTSRESARIWFNTWWPKTWGAPMGFTGDVANGVAGDTSQAFKDEILLRLNIFRRMTGAQPVVFNSTYSVKDQQAALMVSANNELNHNPPTTWKFYTADGASAASQSSLAIGVNGPAAILGYLYDPGASNTATGHRIQMLFPPLTTTGTGDVPAAGASRAANALWMNDASTFSSNLRYTDALVCWPPKGYVPHYLIPGRWSVNTIDGATTTNTDLRSATFNVTKNGQPLTLKVFGGFDLTVWTLDGTDEGDTHYASTTVNGEQIKGTINDINDVTYHVTIDGILTYPGRSPYNGGGVVNGHFEYDVIGYDPNIARVIPGSQSNLSNISTRSFAGADSSTQIAGFIINGPSPRKVLIRAGGPYLTQFGVDGVLSDPVLTLFAAGVQVATNDDWTSDQTNVTAATTKVAAVPFSPGSKDAAIAATLQPGVPYTAQVTGKGGATGNAIVEVYDADDSSASSLINISTRSFVGSGSSIQIGGFILRGAGPRKVLIRAGGPYLSQFGVSGVLADPVLTIYKGTTLIASNDDWSTNLVEVNSATAAVNLNAYASGSKDAAIVLTLDADQPYTAQVSGKDGGSGNALIEVLQLP